MNVLARGLRRFEVPRRARCCGSTSPRAGSGRRAAAASTPTHDRIGARAVRSHPTSSARSARWPRRSRSARSRRTSRSGIASTRFRASSTRSSHDAGIMGILVPEEYGGVGADYVAYALAIEELARVDAGTAVTRLGSFDDLLRRSNASARRSRNERWLPALATGDVHRRLCADRARRRLGCGGRCARPQSAATATATCSTGANSGAPTAASPE